jgi:hypothetical protein
VGARQAGGRRRGGRGGLGAARRAHQLDRQREKTRQAMIGHDRDALVWHQLDGTASGGIEQAPSPSELPNDGS